MERLSDVKGNLSCNKSEQLYLKAQKDKFTEIFNILDGDGDEMISLKAIQIESISEALGKIILPLVFCL